MSKKQQKKMEQMGVKPIFYYEDEVIAVCLLRLNGEVVARGVAVCSPLDQFVKKTGRAKALGMAMHALVHRKTSREMRSERFGLIHPLRDADRKFRWRSGYKPELTEKELAIVSKVR